MELDFGTYDLHAPLPVMYPVRQPLAGRKWPTWRARCAATGRFRPARRLAGGPEIAVTAGSRGISCLPEVLRAVVAEVRARGAEPFLVPAMGSHGGGTAPGQVGMLAELGVTEATIGAPIRATMDVVPVGALPDGPTLYMDAIAAAADGIIVVNRVKPHSDFHGSIESGLSKMTVIGLGSATAPTRSTPMARPGCARCWPPRRR